MIAIKKFKLKLVINKLVYCLIKIIENYKALVDWLSETIHKLILSLIRTEMINLKAKIT